MLTSKYLSQDGLIECVEREKLRMKVVHNETELLEHKIDACVQDIDGTRGDLEDVREEVELTHRHQVRYLLHHLQNYSLRWCFMLFHPILGLCETFIAFTVYHDESTWISCKRSFQGTFSFVKLSENQKIIHLS